LAKNGEWDYKYSVFIAKSLVYDEPSYKDDRLQKEEKEGCRIDKQSY